eukprot:PLAT3287.30.p1 GENE.PLAT3287.30~~PLAT3287.30.p1  ORF type:complete len:581 (-),score=245.65 PLAT3287.30:94-1836(-)
MGLPRPAGRLRHRRREQAGAAVSLRLAHIVRAREDAPGGSGHASAGTVEDALVELVLRDGSAPWSGGRIEGSGFTEAENDALDSSVRLAITRTVRKLYRAARATQRDLDGAAVFGSQVNAARVLATFRVALHNKLDFDRICTVEMKRILSRRAVAAEEAQAVRAVVAELRAEEEEEEARAAVVHGERPSSRLRHLRTAAASPARPRRSHDGDGRSYRLAPTLMGAPADVRPASARRSAIRTRTARSSRFSSAHRRRPRVSFAGRPLSLPASALAGDATKRLAGRLDAAEKSGGGGGGDGAGGAAAAAADVFRLSREVRDLRMYMDQQMATLRSTLVDTLGNSISSLEGRLDRRITSSIKEARRAVGVGASADFDAGRVRTAGGRVVDDGGSVRSAAGGRAALVSGGDAGGSARTPRSSAPRVSVKRPSSLRMKSGKRSSSSRNVLQKLTKSRASRRSLAEDEMRAVIDMLPEESEGGSGDRKEDDRPSTPRIAATLAAMGVTPMPAPSAAAAAAAGAAGAAGRRRGSLRPPPPPVPAYRDGGGDASSSTRGRSDSRVRSWSMMRRLSATYGPDDDIPQGR